MLELFALNIRRSLCWYLQFHLSVDCHRHGGSQPYAQSRSLDCWKVHPTCAECLTRSNCKFIWALYSALYICFFTLHHSSVLLLLAWNVAIAWLFIFMYFLSFLIFNEHLETYVSFHVVSKVFSCRICLINPLKTPSLILILGNELDLVMQLTFSSNTLRNKYRP